MKTLFLSLLVGWMGAGAALAQFAAGADSFGFATQVPAVGGRSLLTDLNACTQQVGEPMVYSSLEPKTAWWYWTATENGLCVVDTLALNYSYPDDARSNSVVAVYTGTNINNLTRVSWGGNYRSHSVVGGEGAATRFYAQKGRTYYFQVSATYLAANSRQVFLSVRPLPPKLLQKELTFTYTRSDGKKDMGALTVLLNPTGSLTGKLRLRSGTYPFSSAVDEAGLITVHVLEKLKPGELPKPPISIYAMSGDNGFAYLSIPGHGELYAYFHDAVDVGDVQVGAWSGVSAGVISAPLVMKVKPNKTVSMAMRAVDGTAITLSSRLFSSPYFNAISGLSVVKFLNNDGGFQMSPYFRFGAGFSMSGDGCYVRREKSGAVFYPGGIDVIFFINAYPMIKPAAGQRALGFLNASAGAGKLRVTDPDGELGGNVDLPLTLETNNKFVFAVDAVRKPTLKLNVTTGQVTGSVILGGKKRNILGAIYDPVAPKLRGYIAGTTRNVRFEVIP